MKNLAALTGNFFYYAKPKCNFLKTEKFPVLTGNFFGLMLKHYNFQRDISSTRMLKKSQILLLPSYFILLTSNL